MHFKDTESRVRGSAGPLGTLGLGGRRLLEHVYSILPASPPVSVLSAFRLCSLPRKLAFSAVPWPVKGSPVAPGSPCPQLNRTVETENLAEWVNCVRLLPRPSLGRRVEHAHPRLSWVASGDPQRTQVGCGSWPPAPFTFRILSTGWDHLPPPALGQEEKPRPGAPLFLSPCRSPRDRHHCCSQGEGIAEDFQVTDIKGLLAGKSFLIKSQGRLGNASGLSAALS